jgi:hypothetical protein
LPEIYHLKEPQKVTVVLSPDEVRRILLMAPQTVADTALVLDQPTPGTDAHEITALWRRHCSPFPRQMRATFHGAAKSSRTSSAKSDLAMPLPLRGSQGLSHGFGFVEIGGLIRPLS